MSFVFDGRTIGKVGIVGSGQIGPDIALHFAKVLLPKHIPVVVVDISPEALEAGKARVAKKVGKGVKSGAFKPDHAEEIQKNITWTTEYDEMRGVDLVVEAATENARVKGKIFKQLEELAASDALLLSNSSHLEPEAIFKKVADRSRTAVVHYFFPAERNRALEVVPGADTAPETVRFLLGFYEAVGKVPVRVASRYGYAIDPVFEGLLQTAARLVEEGVASSKEIDWVATQQLGLGVGPFTAHNLTGGNPITAHGLEKLHTKVSKWFQPPASLLEKVEKEEDWETPARGEEFELDEEVEQKVTRALKATYFGLVCEILDAGLISLADYEMAIEIALVIDAPFAAMNRIGTRAALEMVEELAAAQPDFPVAACLKEKGAANAPWEIPYVIREDRDGVAVLTIRRPKVLNALNAQVFKQLAAHADAIDADEGIIGCVLTGFGTKAFVSGADVSFLAQIETPRQGYTTSLDSQRPLNRIAALTKPVVCALNGLAFGGGIELAMACHARLCKHGLRVLAAQPEPKLGIIPGAGGTQRLPRLIGIEKAAELLRTGKTISGADAVEAGLVREEVGGDVVKAAVDLVRQVHAGDVTLPAISEEPLQDVPESLPDLDIGQLSKAIDAIICRAILEGARLPLRDGLNREAELFADVVRCEDMKIGIHNFLQNGPRQAAEFVHR